MKCEVDPFDAFFEALSILKGKLNFHSMKLLYFLFSKLRYVSLSADSRQDEIFNATESIFDECKNFFS